MRSFAAATVVLAGLVLPATAIARQDAVREAVDRAESAGQITSEVASGYRESNAAAIAARADLDGRRKRELASVIRIIRRIAARDLLTPARMPAVFLTLRRNTEWWSAHGVPSNGGSPGEKGARGRRCKPLPRASASRVVFDGSEIQFQYYPGIGLQLHVNANFTTASALFTLETPEADARAAKLIDELLPLAVVRGGALTWESYFPFGGGSPPWVSSLYQGSIVNALTTAAQRLARPELLDAATRAVGLFARRPPLGVAHRFARDGNWYLHYSFSSMRVLNAHLKAVIALHDHAEATGDPRSHKLYREGLRAARRWIGRYDTGRWSRYAIPGGLADLNYHVLNRDLARSLCKRSGSRAVCRRADRFTRQLDRRCPKASARPT